MIAVWELTKDDFSRFVSRKDIIQEMTRLEHKEKGYADATIRKTISEAQNTYAPFFEWKAPATLGEFKNTENVYRLSDDTVVLHETAFIILDLLNHFKNQKIAFSAIDKTIERCRQYGFADEEVRGRIAEAVDARYLKPAVNGWTVSNRVHVEIDYLKYLSEKNQPVEGDDVRQNSE